MKNYSTEYLKVLMHLALFSAILFTSDVSALKDVSYETQEDWASPLKRCWSRQTGKTFNYISASDNDKISIAFSSDSVLALDSSDGSLVWEADVTSEIVSEPFILGGNAFFLVSADSPKADSERDSVFLESIDLKSGLVNWKKEFPTATFAFADSIQGTRIFVTKESELFSFTSTDGKFLWSVNLGKRILSASYSFNEVVVLTQDDVIFVLSGIDGSILDKINLPFRAERFERSKKDKFLLADGKGGIGFYDSLKNKLVWKRKVGGQISSLSVSDDVIMVSSFDNFLYFFERESGNSLFKERLDGRIVSLPVFRGNIVGVLAYGSLSISLVDVKKKKIVNRVILSDADKFAASIAFVDKYLIVSTFESIVAYSSSCQ